MGRRPGMKLLSLKSEGAVNGCAPLPEQTGTARCAGSRLHSWLFFFFFPSVANLLLSNTFLPRALKRALLRILGRGWQRVSRQHECPCKTVPWIRFCKALQAGHTQSCQLPGARNRHAMSMCVSGTSQPLASPAVLLISFQPPIRARGKGLIVCRESKRQLLLFDLHVHPPAKSVLSYRGND